jgi:hypothetical protein
MIPTILLFPPFFQPHHNNDEDDSYYSNEPSYCYFQPLWRNILYYISWISAIIVFCCGILSPIFYSVDYWWQYMLFMFGIPIIYVIIMYFTCNRFDPIIDKEVISVEFGNKQYHKLKSSKSYVEVLT